MAAPHRRPNRRHEYNIDEFNGKTEAENVGMLGEALVLLPGLAENVLEDCGEPDLVFRKIEKTDAGCWEIDHSIWFSIYYPGNAFQTCVAEVVKIDEDEGTLTDYYQIPYSEVIPRIQAILKARKHSDERWFLAQCDNAQFELWAKETSIDQISRQALCLLKECQNEENETIRDQHSGGVEPEQERTNDQAARKNSGEKERGY